MRILHVTPSYYPATSLGGPIWSTLGLCEALAARANTELTVLTTNMGSQTIEKKSGNEELQVHAFHNYSITYKKGWWGRDVAPGLLGALWRAVNAANIVHLTGVYSFSTVPTLLLARMAGKPVLWSPRGALLAANNWKSVTRPRLKLAWESVCRGVLKHDATVVHATSQAELTASLARLPGLRGVVIPNGIVIPQSVDRPTECSAERRSKRNNLRLLFIGRLDPIKALENLIVAMSLLPRGVAELRIFGTGQCVYIRHLKALVSAAGLGIRVTFEGHIEEGAKAQAFAEADVCIIPSHVESFGMVVAEALAHGVPVIISKGVPWSDVHDRNCGIVTENSPKALAGAILEMSRRDCQTMGFNGRKWVLKEFDWSKICDRFLEVYDTMINGNESRKEPFVRLGKLE